MLHLYFKTITPLLGIFMLLSCQGSSGNRLPDQTKTKTPNKEFLAKYRGNLSSSEYDSIVNVLTLYQDETFDLHQVDRIAEHHLNEKDYSGVYAYLTDSTELALYTYDGVLMLRFLLKDDGLIPMNMAGDKIPDSTLHWKKQSSKAFIK